MPIYEYQCTACAHHFDTIQFSKEKVLTKCPICGEEKLKKLISAPAFHLKGTGWYATDFKDKKPVKPGSEESSESKGEDAKKNTSQEDVKKEVSTEPKDTSSPTTTKKADKAD